jgi:hypothetical protein
MNFKILEQDCSWMIESNLDLKSKEYLEGIGIAEATFMMSGKNPPNDFMEYGQLILVSDNIVNILRKHEGVKAIFSPITFIWNEEKYDKYNFYIMQILEEIECINYEESIYECFASAPTEIKSISKLAVHPVDTDIHKFFIIENTCFLCASNSICDELVHYGCTGFTLTEVSDATI